jgi:predicted phosphodiesterase
VRIAFLSDIHANLEALQSVVHDLQSRQIDQIWSLGDLVGYSCLPRETLAFVRQLGVHSVQGNHDLMAIGRLEPDQCGPNARAAIFWTRNILTQEEKDYLASLPSHALIDSDLLCQHSRFNDPVGYLWRPEQYARQHLLIRQAYPSVRVCFTGHTHIPGVVEVETHGRVRWHYPATMTLQRSRFYFVNPGSVGHPRDGDDRASYAIYDGWTNTVAFHRVAYDHGAVSAGNAAHGVHTKLTPSDQSDGPARQRIRAAFKRMVGAWPSP